MTLRGTRSVCSTELTDPRSIEVKDPMRPRILSVLIGVGPAAWATDARPAEARDSTDAGAAMGLDELGPGDFPTRLPMRRIASRGVGAIGAPLLARG